MRFDHRSTRSKTKENRSLVWHPPRPPLQRLASRSGSREQRSTSHEEFDSRVSNTPTCTSQRHQSPRKHGLKSHDSKFLRSARPCPLVANSGEEADFRSTRGARDFDRDTFQPCAGWPLFTLQNKTYRTRLGNIAGWFQHLPGSLRMAGNVSFAEEGGLV